MEITCTQCNSTFNVPDEKLPKGQKVRIGCPRCKNKIVIDVPEAVKEVGDRSGGQGLSGNGAPEGRLEESATSGAAEDEGYGYEEYAEDKDLDFFEADAKLALVMTDVTEHNEKIGKAIERLGYRFISSPGTRDAIGKMRFHHFDVVVLEDGFDGHDLKNSPVINYLNRLSMSVRRKIFLALVSDDFKTLDDMMAYALSANVVINTKDVDRIQAILRKAISDHEKFYKVFMDILAEVGKA
ncbi:MAG: zinc-ribbon domain-containing protein [Deltaproteobacteria bacterium]|nr:zinc-ribbon domain-containing protein [Deltaproteobacteria bacterium]MBW2137741.1 zinc-ribbon domain-containing protein [Deltaproteobacteria bacterium]